MTRVQVKEIVEVVLCSSSSGILLWEIIKRDFREAFSFNKKLLLQSIGARAFELLGLWSLFVVFC
ncbi:hypothetical protein PanWU01x14_017070 [Parasponia andersonii]|uniref:Uncharacterized protein n=1 Tax=Parasponia andersonii TaxID=3476 RepID=A0A2P5DZT4_PARAD|nr:hypothetical protein PanWU01x14_017070 [Parasponia andersonii]